MADPLDTLFQAANALPPPVPGDNQVLVQCVATLFNTQSGQEIIAQGPLQFTPAKVRKPASFSGSNFSGPAGDANNALSFQTRITLTTLRTPRPRGFPGAYSLTVQAPIFSQSLSLTPQATLANGTYHITATSPQVAYILLNLFAPTAIAF